MNGQSAPQTIRSGVKALINASTNGSASECGHGSRENRNGPESLTHPAPSLQRNPLQSTLRAIECIKKAAVVGAIGGRRIDHDTMRKSVCVQDSKKLIYRPRFLRRRFITGTGPVREARNIENVRVTVNLHCRLPEGFVVQQSGTQTRNSLAGNVRAAKVASCGRRCVVYKVLAEVRTVIPVECSRCGQLALSGHSRCSCIRENRAVSWR